MLTGAGAAVLIAGPTASGKSRLALKLAQERDGVIINADSMQVYSSLRVLTARPSDYDEEMASHRLYGHVAPEERYSVGRWLREVAVELQAVREAGRTPIVVGGTGLYFRALTEGLSEIPEISPETRAEVAEAAAGLLSPDLHAKLAQLDPEDAALIRLSDRGRIVRALEVLSATGLPLAAWRRSVSEPLVDPQKAERVVVEIDRAELHRRIAARAEQMIAAGAIEEARIMAGLGLDADMPAMKAIGVRELIAHLEGRATLAEALTDMATETRRYARRQLTWFRNQMSDWPRIDAGDIW